MRGAFQMVLAIGLLVAVSTGLNWSRRADVSAVIPHPPQAVWDVLAALPDYRIWNPTVPQASGAPALRQPATLLWIGEDGAAEDLQGTWLDVRPPRSLTLEVPSGWPRWFERMYYVRLIEVPGGTRVESGVIVSGLSALWRADGFLKNTAPGLRRMLQGLDAYLANSARTAP